MKLVEQKYKKLTDVEHCLLRPAMWVGSTRPHTTSLFLRDEIGKYTAAEVTYNPALLKIFDEIISNSADEHRRNPKLNRIEVVVDPAVGSLTVRDNGGIPVVMHTEYSLFIPELIFSELKAGSNFDDSEERLVAGTNGVGSTLTNIFSVLFRVLTRDGKNRFEQTFTKNMSEKTAAKVTPDTGRGFTEVHFVPDYSRFGMIGLDEIHVEILRKRCVDVAACNPSLTVTFNGETLKFPKFSDYCKLYTEDLVSDASGRWCFGLTSSDGSFQQVSFVNGIETRDGGTHVDYIVTQVVDFLREKIRKKHKVELRPGEIRNHLMVFVKAEIVNPAFTSQTKEKLITEPRDFGSTFAISDEVLKKVYESEVIQRILDWAQQKSIAEERKQLREMSKMMDKSKVLKLIDAKSRSDRSMCTLALFEGDSASSAFRKYRDPMTQGAFPLRGKFLNVSEIPNSKVIQNKEVKDLLTATGLRMGEPPEDLRYGKILIYADADPDGDSIAGLLMNFFGKYWPEMFDREMIFRVMTPIVIAERAKERLTFHSMEDFQVWSDSRNDLRKWDIGYKKGLAALDDLAYREIIQNPKMFAVTSGEKFRETLDTWFGDNVLLRKKKILGVQ